MMAKMEYRKLPSSCESPWMAPTADAPFAVLWPIGFAILGSPVLLMRWGALLA
jgi:hypothetical protein